MKDEITSVLYFYPYFMKYKISSFNIERRMVT